MFSTIGPVPRYYQLKENLKKEIEIRGLKAHDRIPSTRTLIKNYQLSYSTVSRALAELVDENIIYSLHGKGNFVAEKNRRTRTNNIGVLFYAPYTALEDDSVYSEVFWGMRTEFRENGLDVLVITSPHETRERRDLTELVKGKNMDGLILVGLIDDDILSNMARQGLPIVLVDHCSKRDTLDCVLIDNVDGGYKTTRHLLEWGHTEIAYVGRYKGRTDAFGGPSDFPASLERLEGYRKAMKERGLEARESFIQKAAEGNESKETATRNLLEQKIRPTAIVAFDDTCADCIVKIVQKTGLRVPEDISVVGFGDLKVSDPAIPLTTIAIPRREMGQLAAAKLIARINERETPSIRRILGELVVRQSSARRQ